ncbi:type VII secretion integral membrane protein EccD, partial [Streptomyces sp. NPDC096068]
AWLFLEELFTLYENGGDPAGRPAPGSYRDYLTVSTTATALLGALAATALAVRNDGWSAWTLSLVLSTGLLLRARAMTGVRPRAALAVCGTLGLAAALCATAVHGGPATRGLVALALLGAAALLDLAARRPPGQRMLPVWGHGADLLETLLALALVPLLLHLVGVYAFFRALAG